MISRTGTLSSNKIERFLVTKRDAGQRLDQFLAAKLPALSRSQLKKLIDQESVQVEERPQKPHYKVRPGESVVLHQAAFPATTLDPENIPLNILHEDSILIVLNKPAGLVVHPAAGHAQGTLLNALLHYHPAFGEAGAPERCGLVHRLDKGTSGLMVLAKTKTAQAELARQFQAREVHKLYWALVYGLFQVKTGRFTAPLGRHPKHRQKFAVQERGGRPAETHYTVIEERRPFAIVHLTLKTGRTHQIRVHLSEAGHPIVGDATYGGRRDLKRSVAGDLRETIAALNRPALHALELGFTHPETKKSLLFKCELAEELKKLVSLL